MNLYETILSHFSCYFPHFILGGAPWRLGRQRRSLQPQNGGNTTTTGNQRPKQQRKKKRTGSAQRARPITKTAGTTGLAKGEPAIRPAV